MSKMNFNSMDALRPLAKVVNEADLALNDRGYTLDDSAIKEVLGGALGAGLGGAASFAALYGLGTAGLSAVGITTGLATAGGIIGGGMAAGVFVLAAPVAILGGIGVGLVAAAKRKKLKNEKERLYQAALKKHNGIIQALKQEVNASKERFDLLNSLNIFLQQGIKDLKADLGYA